MTNLIISIFLVLFSNTYPDANIQYVYMPQEDIFVDAYGRFPEASQKDMEALYRLAYAEAGIDGKEGVKGVVWSLERRMQHPQWKGMSIYEIASEKLKSGIYAFNGFQSKHYNIDTLPDFALEGVREAMAEENKLPYGYVFFWNPVPSTDDWFNKNVAEPQQEKKIVIGRHEFYPDPRL